MKTNKVVYLITTKNCFACKCMQSILYTFQKDNPTFTITVTDCLEVPEFIKDSVSLTDFPTTVFVEDDSVKYHFTGTKSAKYLDTLTKVINF